MPDIKLQPLDYLKWFGIFLLGAGNMYFEYQQDESNKAMVEKIANIEVFRSEYKNTKLKVENLEKKDSSIEKLVRDLNDSTLTIIKDGTRDRIRATDHNKDIDAVNLRVDKLDTRLQATSQKVNFIDGFIKKHEQPQYTKYKNHN